MSVAGGTVLEVGCGPGGNLIQLADKDALRLVGVDISPTMLEVARENTSSLSVVELRQVEGMSLPFSDREFSLSFTRSRGRRDSERIQFGAFL